LCRIYVSDVSEFNGDNINGIKTSYVKLFRMVANTADYMEMNAYKCLTRANCGGLINR